MTEFFAYDRLTWPDIASLPRSLPLVLPLGSGYPLDQLASALDEPPSVGILPPVPYGWPNSGIAVSPRTLWAMLSNLLTSLADDGFARLYVLAPQGAEIGLDARTIHLPHPSQYAAFQSLPDDSLREQVVLIPIGHTEQHGYHLPLSTDTLIIEAVSQGAASASDGQAVSLPVMPYGVSTHRSAFAGTLNCGGRAFEDFWLEVIDRLVQRGFTRFYLLSGHGGNSSFLVNVVKYAGERHRTIFCATSYLYLSGPQGVQALERLRSSPIGGMGHACELETSLILHLRPDLVQLPRAVDEMDFVSTPSYYMDWVEGGALIANPPWDDDTKTGAYGAGSLGAADKGCQWLSAAVAEKVGHIAEIHEQYQRRTARRLSGYGQWGRLRQRE
jgi:creatinine amidohydrolase